MRFVKLDSVRGQGDVWVNPEHVVTVAQHNDTVVNICPTFGMVFKVVGKAADVVGALTDPDF